MQNPWHYFWFNWWTLVLHSILKQTYQQHLMRGWGDTESMTSVTMFFAGAFFSVDSTVWYQLYSSEVYPLKPGSPYCPVSCPVLSFLSCILLTSGTQAKTLSLNSPSNPKPLTMELRGKSSRMENRIWSHSLIGRPTIYKRSGTTSWFR